jgi:hypothetical protein
MKFPSTADPRLAAVTGDDGAIARAAVEALFNRHPRTLTIPELEAMQVVFNEFDYPGSPLASVSCTSEWLDAFIAVLGGTITREKVRHGKTVERSVRRYRGREDVRRLRTQRQTNHPTGHLRPRARERRPTATHRTASSSTTSSADPGDADLDAEPASGELRPIGDPLAAELARIADRLRARGGVG